MRFGTIAGVRTEGRGGKTVHEAANTRSQGCGVGESRSEQVELTGKDSCVVKVVVSLPLPPRCRARWYPRRVAGIATSVWPVTVMGVVLLGLLIAPMPIQAQEATPATAGTPRASTPVTEDPECVLPLPADAPISDGTGGSQSVPVASPASPMASPAVSAGVSDAALTGALADTADVIAACLSEGDVETTVSLTSDEARGQLVAGGVPLTPAAFEALLPTLPNATYRIVTLEAATRQAENRATATITYTVANQVLAGDWEFVVRTVAEEERWTLDSITPQPVAVPAEAATIAIETRDGAYEVSPEDAPGPTIALAVTNAGEQEHEVLVLRLAEGVETDVLLSQPGPSFPEGVTYVGDLIVPAGGEGTLLLTDLDPGRYTIVDLLPSPEGVPHLAGGEVATFTVT